MAVPESTSRPFRAILVGGGFVGLTMALALDRAGLDYVLLEKGEVAVDRGASVSMHPHTQRVMEQLAVWPEINAGVVPLTVREHYDKHGRLFETSAILQEISKMCLGRQTSFMERRFWLQCLYNQIRDKNKVRAHTGLASFVETVNDVAVTTTAGEIVTGDVLIGADGIHSTVRRQLADEAAAAGNEAAAAAMRSGFVSKYQCIFAMAKTGNGEENDPQHFLPLGMVHNVYYRGFSGVVAASVPGLVFWFLFVKSDQTSRTPDTPRFSDADAEAVIDRYGHHAAGPGYTFRDLWQASTKAAMLPLEEGVLATTWRSSGGRVVLAGDAVHKSTINAGLGANLATEGVVHLANLLVPLVRRAAAAGPNTPTRLQLADVFSEYETLQRPHADLVVSMSSYITRFEAMDTWWLRLLRRLSPWISDRTKASKFVGYVREGPWLNYLPNPDDERK